MSRLQIFSDGGSRGNPGLGGWAVIIKSNDDTQELSGFEEHTTNNRMELTAAIKALENIGESSEIIFTTDSEYLKKGVTEWMAGWKKKGWRTAGGSPVKNRDLWERLDEVIGNHKITWAWVKGHSGHKENDRVDELVNEVMDSRRG